MLLQIEPIMFLNNFFEHKQITAHHIEPMLQCNFFLWCSNKQNNILIVPQFLSHFSAELSFAWIVVNPH